MVGLAAWSRFVWRHRCVQSRHRAYEAARREKARRTYRQRWVKAPIVWHSAHHNIAIRVRLGWVGRSIGRAGLAARTVTRRTRTPARSSFAWHNSRSAVDELLAQSKSERYRPTLRSSFGRGK